MKNKKVLFLTQAAMIAALYVVLTMISNALGLANQAIQVRFSEALTILPYFTPAAIPGLFIGCFISNIFAGGILIDVIFGSIATLLGALGTYGLRKYVHGNGNKTNNVPTVKNNPQPQSKQRRHNPQKVILTFPPIIANTIIVPLVLKYGYGNPALLFNALTVGIGEIISCGILGLLLLHVLEKRRNQIFIYE